jgi:hypothetical protein
MHYMMQLNVVPLLIYSQRAQRARQVHFFFLQSHVGRVIFSMRHSRYL